MTYRFKGNFVKILKNLRNSIRSHFTWEFGPVLPQCWTIGLYLRRWQFRLSQFHSLAISYALFYFHILVMALFNGSWEKILFYTLYYTHNQLISCFCHHMEHLCCINSGMRGLADLIPQLHCARRVCVTKEYSLVSPGMTRLTHSVATSSASQMSWTRVIAVY